MPIGGRPTRFRIKNEGDSFRKIIRVKSTVTTEGGPTPKEVFQEVYPSEVLYVDQWPPQEYTYSTQAEVDTEDLLGGDPRTTNLSIAELDLPNGIEYLDVTLRFPSAEGKHYVTLIARSGIQSWQDSVELEV